MELTEEKRRQIEEIMAAMECPKDFQCYKSGLEDICRAKDRGMEGYVDCLDKNRESCDFRVPFGGGAFCKCPLRVYLVKNLGK